MSFNPFPDSSKELPKPSKITWLDKFLLKFWPSLEMKRMAKTMKIDNIIFDKLHEVFANTKRIDLFPLNPEMGRGFMLVLNKQTALYFYQDGNHFIYDGFEMGEYNEGEVTIFDHLYRKNKI